MSVGYGILPAIKGNGWRGNVGLLLGARLSSERPGYAHQPHFVALILRKTQGNWWSSPARAVFAGIESFAAQTMGYQRFRFRVIPMAAA